MSLRELWGELKREWRKVVADARADVNRRKWEAKNPVGEPVSEAEAQELIDWYRSLARPALILTPAEDTSADTGFRLGGAPWLADGEPWPTDSDGRPLEFIAEVDFARLPPLEGYPTSGVLRFFVGRNDIFGVDFDAPDQGDIAVLWHPGAMDGGRCEPALQLDRDDGSPFQDENVRLAGKAFDATLASDLPDSFSCEVEARLEGQSRRPGMSELEDELFEMADSRPYGHRIGGHPTFTQVDFRRPGRFDEFDRVLLALTSDDWIMWGDGGEAVFMIRSEDLARRDFSRVAFYWDCH